jgi:hypothetical protein
MIQTSVPIVAIMGTGVFIVFGLTDNGLPVPKYNP